MNDISKEGICKYNMAVECYRHVCENCGWNPAARGKKIEEATETCDRCGKRFAPPSKDYKVESLTIIGRLYGEEIEYRLCPDCEASFGKWFSRWQPEKGDE